ncbi:hypothetical protein ACHQM5_027327 [Ranunculus cassubicifolius]
MAENPSPYLRVYTKEEKALLSTRMPSFYKDHTKEEREELKRQFKQALPPVPPGEEHSYCDFCFKEDHTFDDCPKWYTMDGDVVVVAIPNKRPMLIAREFVENKGKSLKIPSIYAEEDQEEIKRLMKRKIPPVQEGDNLCKVCYSKDHDFKDCPCLNEIPEGVEELSPQYDKICNGCRRIGLACCSKGAFAHRKRCDFCRENGHWYWEELCTKEYRRNARKHNNWMRIKEGKPYLRRPLALPLYTQRYESEVLRLKERKFSAPAGDGCCEICYDKDHPYYECEWLNSVPENVTIGPGFDEVCNGCGKIGLRCCGVGAYVTTKWCLKCYDDGHWFWEETCNFRQD